MNIDIWRVYGAREDTDAAVIRIMAHELSDAQQSASNAQGQVEAMREAIKTAGFRFVNRNYDRPAHLEKAEK